MSLPIKKCPNCHGKIHPFGTRTMSEGYIEDMNGVKYVRYWHYLCEDCGQYWVLDREKNLWEHEGRPVLENA